MYFSILDRAFPPPSSLRPLLWDDPLTPVTAREPIGFATLLPHIQGPDLSPEALISRRVLDHLTAALGVFQARLMPAVSCPPY